MIYSRAVDLVGAGAFATVPDSTRRQTAVDYLDGLRGTPYLWGGSDPQRGLDCSHAVMAAWAHSGIVPEGTYLTAKDLSEKLERVSENNADVGDAVFYGSPVNHVMLFVGDGRVLGATGGGPTTKTVAEARARGAEVRYEPLGYRHDFAFVGRAPVAGKILDPDHGWLLWLAGVGAASAVAVWATSREIA